MFENLQEKLQRAFKSLRGQAKLTEENIDEALREIRLALLEADVNFKVVKQLIDQIRVKAVGQEVWPADGQNPEALAAKQKEEGVYCHHISNNAPRDICELDDAKRRAGVDVAKLKADMQSPEIDKLIDRSHALAQKAGIDGTPTFIANGVMHPGAVDDAALNDMAKAS